MNHMLKVRFLVPCILAIAATVLVATPASAQSGSISAITVSCPANTDTLGSATLTWSADSAARDEVVVWVYAYSTGITPDASAVFVSGHSGTATAPWLEKGHSYVFVLYEDSGAPPSYTPGNFLSQASIQCQ
jgi:hypothetical protein